MNNEVIVHIGMHKTGTTFLQKEVFPKLPFRYYGYEESKEIFKDLIHQEDGQLKRKLGPGLYSFEGLCGVIGTGKGSLHIMHELWDKGGTKVIISMRRSVAMRRSAYWQYVKTGGTMKYGDWVKTTYNWYWRAQVVSWYNAKFGGSNVLKFPVTKLERLWEFLEIEPIEVENRIHNNSPHDASIEIVRKFNVATSFSRRRMVKALSWLNR